MSRANVGGREVILVGDMTSHGGVVMSGSTTNTHHGIPLARLGDLVTCPKCSPGIFKIAQGATNYTDHGIPVALKNHLTECGAYLIAAAASPTMQAMAQNPNKKYDYDEQLQFKTPEGRPIANRSYVLTLSNGDEIRGMSDENGKSQRIGTDKKIKIIKVIFLLDDDYEGQLNG